MFTDPAVAQEHVAKGNLRALAVTSSTRMSAFPHLPTMSEAGLPGYEIVSWIALFAPKGTPAPVVEKLGAAIRTAMQGPEADAFFRTLAMEPSPTTPAQLRSFVESEIEKWGQVIRAAGLPKQ
jgi:tripartite-type tricarboxylate transporter receptor subunit TctC